MDKLAVYPGSFDPITNGHLDLLERGLRVFDRVLIAIAANPGKQPLFTLKERLALVGASLKDPRFEGRVKVDAFQGLLVDYVRKVKAHAILRGLRAVSDFEYEFPMAMMNSNLSTGVETFFLMTGMRYSFISSSIVKEVVLSGGCVAGLVPESVEKRLAQKLLEAKRSPFHMPRIVAPRARAESVNHKWAS